MLTIIIYLLNINNYYISIKYRSITDGYIPYLKVVKGKPCKNHKDDLKTVLLFEKLSLYGYDNFKKGHNSRTPKPNLANHMSCTFTLYMYRV